MVRACEEENRFQVRRCKRLIVTDLRSGRSCLTPEKLNYKEEVFRFVQDDYYVLWRMKAMNIFSYSARQQ